MRSSRRAKHRSRWRHDVRRTLSRQGDGGDGGFEVAHEERRPLARFLRHVGDEVGAVDQQDGGTLGGFLRDKGVEPRHFHYEKFAPSEAPVAVAA
jgi:hypothetical protein